MTVKKSQVGDVFLHDVFSNADPDVAQFMARHNALLERVTVLEKAIEEHRCFTSQIDASKMVEHSPIDEKLWAALDA